jgi:hypothetical protein
MWQSELTEAVRSTSSESIGDGSGNHQSQLYELDAKVASILLFLQYMSALRIAVDRMCESFGAASF